MFGAGPVQHTLFLLALVWCGPPADLVVRAVVSRTGLPAPEAASAADTAGPGRHQLLEYVVVGSLASWGQAIVLGLVVAG